MLNGRLSGAGQMALGIALAYNPEDEFGELGLDAIETGREIMEPGQSLAGAQFVESAASNAATARAPFAMGLEQELDSFAEARGAATYKQLPDPANWKPGVLDKLADPSVPVHFNLNGVDLWAGVQRAAAGAGGATDWELLQIQQNPQFWESLTFWKDGQIVPNPFQ